MPKRPLRPCLYQGCPNLVESGYCEEHKRHNARQRDSQRETANQRGYTYRWQKARKVFLNSHPLCTECEQQGKITEATLVDHIIPHKGSMDLFWDVGNWQSLCKQCHDIKTVTEDGGFVGYNIYRPGNLKPSLVPLTIICGPPGSGKSYYANSQALPGSAVIDLDVIKAQVTKAELYERNDEQAMKAALVKRNYILAELGRQKMFRAAYFIISAPTISERRWWVEQLRPVEAVVMEVPRDVCIERVKADSRRPEYVKAVHIDAINNWWGKYERGRNERYVR